MAADEPTELVLPPSPRPPGDSPRLGAPSRSVPHPVDPVDLVAPGELFAQAFERAPIGMALVAPDGRWLRVNAALCRLTGRSAPDLLAGSWQDITHPDDLAPDLALLRDVLDGLSDGYQLEKRYLRPDGTQVWVLLAVSLVRGPDDTPLMCISQVVDITERKRVAEQLLHAATHDPLTDLCNRATFHNALTEALARGERYEEPVALLLVDLDGFKSVNDEHGHQVGDEVLCRAADAVRAATRAADVCARLGGDELAVLLPRTDAEHARAAAARVVAAIRAATGGRVTASVGLALGAEVPDASEWLRRADAAMYRAKRAGGDQSVEHRV